MRTRTLVATALCATALLIPATPAFASHNGTVQGYGCPASRALAPLAEVYAAIDWRAYTPEQQTEIEANLASAAVDMNQDGLLCYRPLVQNAGRDKKYGVTDYQVLGIGDNNVVGR